MCSLHYFCPTYQQQIDTGIEVDDETFAKARLRIVRVLCAHCDRVHRFLLADAEKDLAPLRTSQFA